MWKLYVIYKGSVKMIKRCATLFQYERDPDDVDAEIQKLYYYKTLYQGMPVFDDTQ